MYCLIERLIELLHSSNSNQYHRRTERLDQIAGQYSLFDEAEAYSEEETTEPDEDEVLIKVVRKKKRSGQREENVKDLPREAHDHLLTDRVCFL